MLSTSRRNLLRYFGGGAALSLMAPRWARASENDHRVVFAYFEGGWDTFLGLDPRDPRVTDPQTHKIELGYEQLPLRFRSRGDGGVQTIGDLRFGPAVPTEFVADFGMGSSIVNGIAMGTPAHEAGRRYFLTGQRPRGSTAVGASAATEIAYRLGDASAIPQLSAAVEAYAGQLPAFARALEINGAADISVALTPFADIPRGILDAVEGFQDAPPGCAARRLDGDGLVTAFVANQRRTRDYVRAGLGGLFDYSRTDAEMSALRMRYGIEGKAVRPTSPEVLGFIAGQAIKHNVSQVVSLRVATGLDTHSAWAANQAPNQERGWRVLDALMRDLAAQEDRDGSLLDRTTFVVFSEFSRTPMFNNLGGKDHHIANSCLLRGPGIGSGRRLQASSEVGAMPLPVDTVTGQVAGAGDPGEVLSPQHILATVMASLGFESDSFRARALPALLR